MVARSSAEAELRSVALGICEGLWLKILLEELGMIIKGSVSTYCDNKAAISVSHNPIYHDQIKHEEIDRHLLR